MKGITQMHHFHFSQNHPGAKNTTDNWRIISLLKDPSWRPSATDTTLVITRAATVPIQKIVEFCPAQCQDLVCPQPQQLSQQEFFIMSSCINVLYHTNTYITTALAACTPSSLYYYYYSQTIPYLCYCIPYNW